MKLAFSIDKKTNRPLLCVNMDDNGIVIKSFLSVIFKESSLIEINQSMIDCDSKVWSKGETAIDFESIKSLVEQMELEEISASFISTSSKGEITYFNIKRVEWK